jgi:hypothetical protein
MCKGEECGVISAEHTHPILDARIPPNAYALETAEDLRAGGLRCSACTVGFDKDRDVEDLLAHHLGHTRKVDRPPARTEEGVAVAPKAPRPPRVKGQHVRSPRPGKLAFFIGGAELAASKKLGGPLNHHLSDTWKKDKHHEKRQAEVPKGAKRRRRNFPKEVVEDVVKFETEHPGWSFDKWVQAVLSEGK